MTLIIDGLDISSYINQKIDIAEKPSYVDGINSGTAKNGSPIWDRIHTCYVLSVPLKPLPQAIYQQIIEKCEKNYMAVEYTSARTSQAVTCNAQCSLNGWTYATTTSSGDVIYSGATITVETE